jgi:hypothetical protein
MGYFRNLLTYDELVDIAAYLGNSPGRLAFVETRLGMMSNVKNATLSSSLKVGVDKLSLQILGPFQISQTNCATAIPRFESCTVGVVFAPKKVGELEGALIIRHANSPVPIEIKLQGKGV